MDRKTKGFGVLMLAGFAVAMMGANEAKAQCYQRSYVSVSSYPTAYVAPTSVYVQPTTAYTYSCGTPVVYRSTYAAPVYRPVYYPQRSWGVSVNVGRSRCYSRPAYVSRSYYRGPRVSHYRSHRYYRY